MAAEIMQGATLAVDAAGGAPTDAIGDLVSMSGPGTTRTVIQIGSANSANSLNVQKAGRVTLGVWTFVVNLDPAVLETASETDIGLAYDQLQTISATINTTPYAWLITLIDGSTWAFTGFVSNFNIDGVDDGNLTASFSVAMQSKITGAVPP